MRKVITAFIATLLFGTYLVHADVYVKLVKYSKPKITTQQEFEAKALGNKVESSHGTFFGTKEVDYEIVRSDTLTRYIHYKDVSEEDYWKNLEFQIQSGQGS